MIVEGTFAEFKKYFGTAYFGNLVEYMTRNVEAKRTYTCEGINGRSPHRVDREGEIRFCHPPDRSRLDVLYEVLTRYRIDTSPEVAETFRCEMNALEEAFRQAHRTMFTDQAGKFLCRDCEREYK